MRSHERWKPRVRLLYTLRLPARLVGHAHNWGSFVQEGGGGEGGGGGGGGVVEGTGEPKGTPPVPFYACCLRADMK